MNKRNDTVFAVLIGATIGALIGVLFAPKSGKESRNSISELLQKVRNWFKLNF